MKDTIFIYNGLGVSKESLKQTELAIKKNLSPPYVIEKITPKQVIKNSWEKKAVLFVIPGGRDVPYTRFLNGIGNQKIKNYVENGGSFLGICAGSYYAGAFVDFAADTSFPVQGKRELAFFPGVVKGPIHAPYSYFSKSGARAVSLIWGKDIGFLEVERVTVFYHGGGYFVGASDDHNLSVLAYYDKEKHLPAMIQCQVGQGKAILSGVHLEYDPFLLDAKDPYLAKIIPSLFQTNKSRERLFTQVLKRLLF